MDDYLTVAEIAQKLRVNPETVKVWLRTKRLDGFILSDRAGWRVARSEIERFIEERKLYGGITTETEDAQ